MYYDVLVTDSFVGVVSMAILTDIVTTIEGETYNIRPNYVNKVDYTTLPEKFNNSTGLIILGLPYKGELLPSTFKDTFTVPFMDFVHVNTYGEEIPENVTSIVQESIAPVQVLLNDVQENPKSYIMSVKSEVTTKTNQMAQALTDYIRGNWSGNQLTKMLFSLYKAVDKQLPSLITNKSIEQIVKSYAHVIKGQMNKQAELMEWYKSVSRECRGTYNGKPVIVRAVRADDYINEIAERLLQVPMDYQGVAMVVRQTRGGDMIAIRTTDNIDATEFAQNLLGSDRGGTDRATTVFLESNYTDTIIDGVMYGLSANE